MSVISSPYAFQAAYAARSNISVEELRAGGRVVIACDCGEECCEGWQSISRENAQAEGYRKAPDVTDLLDYDRDAKWYY